MQQSDNTKQSAVIGSMNKGEKRGRYRLPALLAYQAVGIPISAQSVFLIP